MAKKALTPPPNYPCHRCANGVAYATEAEYVDHLREDHADDRGARYMVDQWAKQHVRSWGLIV